MATPEDQVGSVEEFTDVQDKVVDTDDGGAIVTVGEDESKRPDKNWFDNIADDFEDAVKGKIATRLLEDIDRDKRAREIDRPPFKVLSGDAMLRIATALPESRRELTPLKGISSFVVSRMTRDVLRGEA